MEASGFLRERLAGLEGPVLDLACGRGRNARAVAAAGLSVFGLDRSPEALAEFRRSLPESAAVRADLEGEAGIPFRAGAFGSVLVFRYLHRPLCAAIAELLRPGGRLIYETFTVAQRALGHGPSRDAFLLQPGELPELFPMLRPEHFEEVRTEGPRPEALARLVARKPA